MAAVMQRPVTSASSRPRYMDELFKAQRPPLPQSKSPSLRSTNSSISFTSGTPIDLRAVQPNARALSPALEEDHNDDRGSVRSLRLTLSPRSKFKSILNRRTYPQVKETVEYQTCDVQQRPAASRRPSLPKLQTAFSQPQKSHRRTSKPLPGPPPAPPEGLSSQPCYYFHARNCNGYVLGGSHGDACETCAQAGFFGAP